MHLAGPALQPLQVAGIGAPLGDPGAGVGQSPQAEEARSTLGRALAREVAHDAGDLANGALPGGQHAYDAASERQAAGPQGDGVDGQGPGAGGFDPPAEVAAEQDGPT